MDDQVKFLIVIRAFKGLPVPSDHKKSTCDMCGSSVWLKPEQAERRRQEKSLKVMCTWCVNSLHPGLSIASSNGGEFTLDDTGTSEFTGV